MNKSSEEKTVRKMPCEIYCRVTGYFRPVSNFNPGKQEEFWEREAVLKGKDRSGC